MLINQIRTIITKKSVVSYVRELLLGVSIALVMKTAAKLWLLLFFLLVPTDSTNMGYMSDRKCAPTVALVYTRWPERSAFKCRRL